jgi:DNA-directed RNA polymerase sigma subunit (sigma70/sigma32)
MNVTRERIRQIEVRAQTRKLAHRLRIINDA